MEIKLVDLEKNIKNLRYKINDAISDVINDTDFIMGQRLEEFESSFANYCGSKYAIGVASGTAALMLVMKAMGIGKGDEVVTSPFTFFATAEAILHVGATPVFVDIDPERYTLDPSKLSRVLTSKTKVIMPVHLFGQIAEMEQILTIAHKNDIYVIEDAAQSHGAVYNGMKAGSLGDAGCISFYPGKNLGAFGDAGVVITDDDDITEKVRMLRNHGRKEKYIHDFVGYGERMDVLQAAILNVKLPYLEGWNDLRRRWAEHYFKNLQNTPGVLLPKIDDISSHVFHIFAIQSEYIDYLKEYLASKVISTVIHYPLPLHMQPALHYLNYSIGEFPVSEELANKTLSLPMYPELTAREIEYICNNINDFFNNRKNGVS